MTRRTEHTITTMEMGASDSKDDSNGNFEEMRGAQEWENDNSYNVPMMVSGIRKFHER